MTRLLNRLGIPSSLGELTTMYGARFDSDALVRAMRLDKKSNAGEVRLVLPVCAGEAIYDVAASEDLLARVLASPVARA